MFTKFAGFPIVDRLYDIYLKWVELQAEPRSHFINEVGGSNAKPFSSGGKTKEIKNGDHTATQSHEHSVISFWLLAGDHSGSVAVHRARCREDCTSRLRSGRAQRAGADNRSGYRRRAPHNAG